VTQRNTLLALGVGVLVVSTASVLIRELLRLEVSASTVAALRLSIASLVMAIAAFGSLGAFQKISFRVLSLTAISGICLAAHFITWIQSLKFIPVATSTFLVTTSPIWVALFSFFFLKETVGKKQFLGILIAIGGAGIVLSTSPENRISSEGLLGETLAVIGAVSIAIYFVIARYLKEKIDLRVFVFLAYLFASFVVIIWMLIENTESITIPNDAWFFLIALALGPQAIGHTIFNWAVRRVPATTVSTAILGEPIFASILAWWWLSEKIDPVSAIGFITIVIGILISTRTALSKASASM
jgi:drug/metabolite transporter (DMT)-like permease